MTYKVYGTQFVANSMEPYLHTETQDSEISVVAMNKLIERLGPTLVIIRTDSSGILDVKQGKK